MAAPTIPPGLMPLLEALRAAGGRPYVVGGAVRDALLGRPVKDYDVEVFGLSADVLKRTLAGVGRVNAVGEAFTVFKVHGLAGLGDVDVALPRRDSKAGAGHRGIAVHGDPDLPVAEAARRRDFTLNALLYDPFTAEIVDPWGGRADLAAKVLRATDLDSFGEDPLRALRAVQMAARFELRVDAATAATCAAMPLHELPAERVFGEIEKLLLQARRPSVGLELLRAWGLLPGVAPELLPLIGTPQEPEWHPEGDVWTHTLLAVDEGVKQLDGLDHARRLTVMLAVLCHDLGKPATTRFVDGRFRSPDHEQAGVAPTSSLLDRWKVFSLDGYDVRGQVVALVADHLKPGMLFKDKDRVSDGAIRRLAARCEADLLDRVARADNAGRAPGCFPPDAMDWFIAKVRELEVTQKAPDPLLRGRDVLALGVLPGPEVGRIVKAVYEKQLDGVVTTLDEAVEVARGLVAGS